MKALDYFIQEALDNGGETLIKARSIFYRIHVEQLTPDEYMEAVKAQEVSDAT